MLLLVLMDLVFTISMLSYFSYLSCFYAFLFLLFLCFLTSLVHMLSYFFFAVSSFNNVVEDHLTAVVYPLKGMNSSRIIRYDKVIL
jgi:hypothetical protein